MGIEGYYEDYFDERQEKEKLTNFQKIKNMSIDELAEFFNTRGLCERHTPCSKCQNAMWCECSSQEDYKKWLEGATL